MLIPDQTIQTAGRRNHNVGTGFRVLDQFHVFLKWCPAIKHRRPDIWQILAESRVLVSDLKGQFTGVAEDEDSDFAVDGLDLLEGREDKDGCLAEPRFGLAEDIG
jgi:hypothetical protein